MANRRLGEYFLLGARGIAMGAADVIPGVSGGTIAFITGIYEELINSIKSVDRQLFLILRKEGIAKAWKHLNGNFLVSVFIGIFISIFSLARLITWLLDTHPKYVWAFFFGLIVASALHVGKKITRWNSTSVISLIAGTAVAAYITIATPATTPETWWFVLISGMIAITAMILPGISGSFILLLLGKYEYILSAVKDLKIGTIVIFGVGCVIGIVSFSNIISWLFRKYYNATLAILTGFMIGSLNKLWPWKQVITSRINSEGIEVPVIEKSISPYTYSELYNEPNQLTGIIIFALVGLMIILLFDLLAARNKQPNSN
jgi:putative membrane protein